jgi:hypothetical protein
MPRPRGEGRSEGEFPYPLRMPVGICALTRQAADAASATIVEVVIGSGRSCVASLGNRRRIVLVPVLERLRISLGISPLVVTAAPVGTVPEASVGVIVPVGIIPGRWCLCGVPGFGVRVHGRGPFHRLVGKGRKGQKEHRNNSGNNWNPYTWQKTSSIPSTRSRRTYPLNGPGFKYKDNGRAPR